MNIQKHFYLSEQCVEALLSEAKKEQRSASRMAEVLIREAIAARIKSGYSAIPRDVE